MIFIFLLILNCFCIVFMVFNFLIYFTRFCDHLSQKNNGHLLTYVALYSIWQRSLASTRCGLVICKLQLELFSCSGAQCLEGEFLFAIFWLDIALSCLPAVGTMEKQRKNVTVGSVFLAGLQIYLGHGQLCPWHVLQLLSSFCCWPQQTLQPCCSSIKSPQSLCMSSLVSIKPTVFLSFANNVAELLLHLFRFILNVTFIYPE